jgi:hypothetical protein
VEHLRERDGDATSETEQQPFEHQDECSHHERHDDAAADRVHCNDTAQIGCGAYATNQQRYEAHEEPHGAVDAARPHGVFATRRAASEPIVHRAHRCEHGEVRVHNQRARVHACRARHVLQNGGEREGQDTAPSVRVNGVNDFRGGDEEAKPKCDELDGPDTLGSAAASVPEQARDALRGDEQQDEAHTALHTLVHAKAGSPNVKGHVRVAEQRIARSAVWSRRGGRNAVQLWCCVV